MDRARHDHLGTLLLALTLAAYALAMTMGRGRFGPLNIALLSGAVLGAALFVLAEARAASPLIRLAMLRDRVLGTGLATSALVSTVMMATLVVGPFYLSRALGLGAALVGLVLSVGPLVAALTAAPAGRIVDRLGAPRLTIVGLAAIATGAAALSLLPASFGVAGYVGSIVVITAGYALFQTANNTAVMSNVRPDQRGVVSGMLNLSRNLGLITGAAGDGRGVRLRIFIFRHHDGATRRRFRRHASHLRRRRDADRRRTRHRGSFTCARDAFARRRVMTDRSAGMPLLCMRFHKMWNLMQWQPSLRVQGPGKGAGGKRRGALLTNARGAPTYTEVVPYLGGSVSTDAAITDVLAERELEAFDRDGTRFSVWPFGSADPSATRNRVGTGCARSR
jgi:hypothetical protein